MKTAIVTDSNSGITQAEAQKMNVFVLPMPVIIEGQAYYEGIDLLPDQFFRALTERQAVSTSQPSPGDVTALWDKVLAEYEELVYIPMSSGLSASCATAQMLAEDYEGRVFVVDNHRISISQKSSAWDAVALREAGCGAQEIQRELEASGLDSIVYVGVETLEYLRRGGRVTAGSRGSCWTPAPRCAAPQAARKSCWRPFVATRSGFPPSGTLTSPWPAAIRTPPHWRTGGRWR